MSLSAGTLALWIGTAFALAAAIAGATARPGDARAWVAGRALAMAAAFSTLASIVLLDALRRHDLTIDYVARHSTHGAGLATALLGAFAEPSGAGLLVASAIGATGAWFARGARAPAIASTCAVMMVVLLAAPLAARALATLPWVPVDGQDALLFFREGLSVLYVLGLTLAMVAGAVALGSAIERWRQVGEVGAEHVAAHLAFAGVAIAIVSRTWVALASGLSRDTSPLGMLGGIGALALAVSLASMLLLTRGRPAGQEGVSGALAAVLAALALTLTAPAAVRPGMAVQVLAVLSIGVSLVALWQGRSILARAVRAWRPRRLAGVAAMASLGVTLAAAVTEVMSRPRVAALPSGGNVAVSSGTLDHLGISRYEDHDSQVLALALEKRRGGSTRLASAEHREYFDARGGVLGGLVRTPALLHGPFTTIVWLEQVQAKDDVTLVVADRSPILWWWGALAFALVAVVASLAGRARVDPAPVA